MKQKLLSIFCTFYCAMFSSVKANELVNNVKITSVEELVSSSDIQSVIIKYSGVDRRCLSDNVQTISFHADTSDEINALNRISMTALLALETGGTVKIVGAIDGDCSSANGIVLGGTAEIN